MSYKHPILFYASIVFVIIIIKGMGMRLSNRQHKYSNILTYDTIMFYYTIS